MYSIVLTELGIAVFDENKSVSSIAFADPATDFVKVKEGEYKLYPLVESLRKLNVGFMINDEAILKTLRKESLDVQLMSEKQIEQIQANKPQVLIDAGFAKDQADAMSKLRDFALQLSSARVTEVSQSPDLHIIQSIKALDEIDVMMNGLSSRLREWYGLHFPELDNIIDSINGHAQIVLAGRRDDLSKQVYEDAGFPESKVEMLSVVQDKSKGGEITDKNLLMVQSIANQILQMVQIRKNLEDHIEAEMKTIAPNLAAILGTAVGARILSKAGSLKKLASLPASTIQVLGAEKALFRALKTGTQPPKHGILFQHATVHAAPKWQRGKMARAIASKAAIAARVDVYGGGLNQTLLEKLNVRVTEIGQKYKEPSQKPPQPQRMEIHDNRHERRGGRFGDKPRERRFGDKPRKDRFGGRPREGSFRDRPREGRFRGGDSRREFRSDSNKRKKFGKRR
jgi:nucleolar protein 56